MAFTNDDIQEIREIVQEVIGETADPIEDTTQVDALEEGDIVAIVRAVGGVNSYKKASVGLFGGGGGSSITVDSALSTTSKNPVQNKVVTAALNGKQATLIGSGTGQNIKTVGGQNLLGTGDIPVSGGAGTVPVITATATVDATTGTPAVSVVKSGTDTAPNFAFAFTGLKGEPGSGGGGTGTVTGAKVGQDGTPINPDTNGVLTFPAYEANADVTDAENVKNALGVQQGGTRYLKEDGTWDTPEGGGGGTQKGTKVYLVANGGVLPAMESTNVVYVISYAYTISGSVTVPAGCALEFAGGSVNGGTLVLNGTYLYGNIKFGTGITISGTCKNGTAYQKWFMGSPLNIDAWHRFINNVEGPSCYEYEFGSYAPTVRVSKQLDDKGVFHINGNNATLTFAFEQNSKAFLIKPKNNETYRSATISSAVNKGDTQISVSSASNLNAGDIISIRDNTNYSFSPHDSNYKQCEFAVIREISGSTLVLTHPVFGTYQNLSGTSMVYAFNTISCHISDLIVKCSEPSSPAYEDIFDGIEIWQAVGASISNVKVYGSNTCIRFYSSSNVMVENCTCKVKNTHVPSGSTYRDSFALSLSGCQNASIIGGEYMGGKQAVTIGGANSSICAIDREILVKNVRAYTIQPVAPHSIDMHGCSEYVTIEGCTTSGIHLKGKNNKILNNFIYDNIISGGEFANFNHVVSGNIMRYPTINIKAPSNMNKSGFVKDGTEDTFVISNNSSYDSVYTESGSTKTYSLVTFVSAEIASDYYNLANTTLVIEGNNIRNALNYVTSFATVIVRNNTFTYDASTSTALTSYPKLFATRLFVEGNKFMNYGYYTGWSYNNIKADYLYVRNNYAESSSSTALFVSKQAATEMYVDDNIVKGKFMSFTHAVGSAYVRNNNIEPTSLGVTISGTTTKAYIFNNVMGAQGSIDIAASSAVYGRNVLSGTLALTAPTLPSSATKNDLDAGSSPSSISYSATTYDVATSSYNGNTSGTVTIDGTKAVTVLAITGDVTSLELASGKTPEAGHSAHVILSASSARSVTIVHNSSTRVCPKSANLTLSVTAGGYAEVDFINANSKIYVRGV